MIVDVNINQTINHYLKSRFTNDVSDSIQRLTSGLKINDSADDVGGLVNSTKLNSISSSLLQGIENGNDGLALVQVSNKALESQLDILSLIKEKLDVTKLENTSSSSREAIRTDIIDLLTDFDNIASDINYNNIYTLQKSSTDNDYSDSTTITLDVNSNSSITTESIKSNSEGLNLSTLKNLSTNDLTNTVSLSQLDIVEEAITSIEEYSASFDLSKEEISITIENLTGIEKITSNTKDTILNVNKSDENAILNKYKLLEKRSEFAIVQANILQSTVQRLLTEMVDFNEIYEKTSSTNETNYNNSKSKDNYSNTSYPSSNGTTSKTDSSFDIKTSFSNDI